MPEDAIWSPVNAFPDLSERVNKSLNPHHAVVHTSVPFR